MAFRPEFDHDRSKIYDAIGLDKKIADIIRKFQNEYCIDIPSFAQASVMLEYFWNKIPKEIKDEPFYLFYLSTFIGRITTQVDRQSFIMN